MQSSSSKSRLGDLFSGQQHGISERDAGLKFLSVCWHGGPDSCCESSECRRKHGVWCAPFSERSGLGACNADALPCFRIPQHYNLWSTSMCSSVSSALPFWVANFSISRDQPGKTNTLTYENRSVHRFTKSFDLCILGCVVVFSPLGSQNGQCMQKHTLWCILACSCCSHPPVPPLLHQDRLEGRALHD